MSVELIHQRCGTDHLPTEPCPADADDGHRIITQGPLNVRDWRITCLCMERFVGAGAKDAKRKWLEHAAAYNQPRDPRDVYGTDEHEAWLIEMERQEP